MADAPSPLYPLRFAPIYKEKVWGGRALETLGRELPATEAGMGVGESWELADLGHTAKSGGGGGAARSRVANGPLAGRTLHDLMATYGRDLLGDLSPNEFGQFPLLVKFLDARENLSVQVHPSAAYAARHEDAYLKSEAWYVLDCEPGAVIYKGVKQGVTPERMRAALEKNTDEAVMPLLIEVAVEPGDCHYLPSGTCHALGAGVLASEVQTPSDTTFRVYDWGRVGRELHIEPALQCIDFGPPDVSKFERHTHVRGEVAEITRLVACEYFRIDRYAVEAGRTMELGVDQPTVWMVLEGEGTITAGDKACTGSKSHTPAAPFTMGQTWLLPPAMSASRVRFDAPTTWLEVTFPQTRSRRLA